MENKSEVFIGIDVSKDSLAIDSGKSWTVSNDPKGVGKLIQSLAALSPRLVVLESTGGYEELALKALWKAGIPVSRVSPRRTKGFANSLGQNAKTDPIDARMLRLFAAQIKPTPTPPPSAEVLKIKPLIDRRVQLIKLSTREKNHLKCPTVDAVTRKSIKKVIAVLTSEIEKIDALIKVSIDASEELAAKAAVISQNIGVGPVLTAMLIVDVPELGTVPRETISALIGVAPFDNKSGGSTGKQSIYGGRKHVRTVLYMATVSSLRYNPRMKAFYRALVARGKLKKVALVATMRRLLIAINASMRDFLQARQQTQSVATYA